MASPATIRLPDILSAMDRFELRTHPDEREVTRASNEWFNRYVLSLQAKSIYI